MISTKNGWNVKLSFNGPYTPECATQGSSGYDLKAWIGEGQTKHIIPGERMIIPTGIRMQIPYGYEGQVRPRSGSAIKQGMSVLNSPGTIDSDYRGEIGVILINLGKSGVTIKHGDKIAQLVICPIINPGKISLEYSEELSETKRGPGGFGHTGV